MEQNNTNWVAERAKCEIDQLVADIMRLVQEATNQAHELPLPWAYIKKENRTGCRVTCVQNNQPVRECLFVHEPDRNMIQVVVRRQIASQPDELDQTYTIGTRWDAEKSKCRIVVNSPTADEPLEFPHKHLWKAIQYILEPFFFPKESPTAS
ncbi:MAG: hypothetical protein OXC18_02225 [Desulfurellaceae bacterium]|nr:hypothetical protein [Desulfurellaceae bacterium]